MIIVEKAACVGCEECLYACPTKAIIMKRDKAEIIQHKCDHCELCIIACPVKAIKIVQDNK
ncbi:MAG: 4Fe-4S dicluster domain-containing protein [Planctomycetes bacterium]|nr:4Fe-4S dicluster domain-containing protein [Planctomycetota bacterium]